MTRRIPAKVAAKIPAKTAKKAAAAKKVTARKATPAKRATSKRATAKKTAPSSTSRSGSAGKASTEAPPTSPRGPKPGMAEAATRSELEQLQISHSALAVSAILLARQLDQAESPSGASAAARELRMTLATAKSVTKPLSPPGEGDEGKVEPPNRLEQLRRKRERAEARRRRA